jgi:hypothetical protein
VAVVVAAANPLQSIHEMMPSATASSADSRQKISPPVNDASITLTAGVNCERFGNVQAPVAHRAPGRHKQSRHRNASEPSHGPKAFICTVCNGKGHTRRSCTVLTTLGLPIKADNFNAFLLRSVGLIFLMCQVCILKYF